jgi:hypothetical protein
MHVNDARAFMLDAVELLAAGAVAQRECSNEMYSRLPREGKRVSWSEACKICGVSERTFAKHIATVIPALQNKAVLRFNPRRATLPLAAVKQVKENILAGLVKRGRKGHREMLRKQHESIAKYQPEDF